MKTFTNWLRWCTSRQKKNKMKEQHSIYDNKLFWKNQPSTYASMYMKHDWFNTNRTFFVAKYIFELLTSKLTEKKKTIKSIILPMWSEMTTEDKYKVLQSLCKGIHVSDSLNLLLDFQEIVECEFLSMAINKLYYAVTGQNYNTNVFATFGIISKQ